MTDLIPFDFDGQAVRVVTIDGEPWFVLADLTRTLGLAQFRTDRLEGEVIRSHPIPDRLGRTQQWTIVSEPGMYEVVIRSDKPHATRFRRWIAGEVLPSIRRTGSYSPTPALTDAEIVHQALQITSRQVEALTAQVAELEPRAAVADHLLNATGDMSVGDAAKALARSGAAIGATRLFALLDDLGWTYRSAGVRHIKQRAIEAGYLAALPKSHYHPKTGDLVVDPPQVRVTPKGIARLLTHLLAGEEAA